MTHLSVNEEVEDHEAEEGDEVHHEEVQPHDVDLDIVSVASQHCRNDDPHALVLRNDAFLQKGKIV